MYLALLGFACAPPPVKAPEDLEALTTFIYENMMNPDPRYVEAGATNLKLWLDDHYEEANEGYEVNNLSEEAVLNLGIDVPELFEEQVGVAAAYRMRSTVDQVANVLITVSCEDTNPDGCSDMSTEHESDPTPFLNRDVETHRSTTTMTSHLPLSITLTTDNTNEYRWTEVDGEPTLITRTWITETSESNVSWAELIANFYLSVVFETDEGSMRMSSSWAILKMGNLPVPRNMALNMAVDSLLSGGDDIDGYYFSDDD